MNIEICFLRQIIHYQCLLDKTSDFYNVIMEGFGSSIMKNSGFIIHSFFR